MAASGIDERLLFEVAPPLLAAGRPTVAAQLRELILDPEPARWSPGLKDALRLAALTYQIAKRLVSDIGAAPRLPIDGRWRPRLERGWLSVPASSLIWEGVDVKEVRPLLRTQRYLDDLPEAIVDRALRWAAPVISPPRGRGEHWVIAGHVSALIARQRRPGDLIRVRRLHKVVSWKRPLAEVCADTVQVLAPLFRRHRRFLVANAMDDREALFLTGYSRPQYFRIKGEADGRKPAESRTKSG